MLKTRACDLKGFILLSFVFLWSVVSVNAAAFTVTKTADTNDGICDADCSLREAITAANAASSDDVISFEPAVFSASQTIVLGGTQLFIINNGSLTIEGTGANLLAVSGNNASRILLIDQRVSVTLNNLTLRNGNGQGSYSGGGAIYSFGNLTLNNVVVTNNTATGGSGGGINNNDSLATLTINNSVITNNSSNISGGGIVNFNVMHLNNSTVTNNSSSENAGGIFSGGPNNRGQLTVTNSTISNNMAVTTGAGVYLGAGAASFVNSTISGNLAFGDGGGIYTLNGTTASLIHSTISQNRADYDQSGGGVGGGIYNLAGGVVSARSSLIGDNTAPFGTAFDWRGTVSSEGFNLIENTTGTTISGNTNGNITGQDPQLLPLGTYGGATRTVALAPLSPAIDAADPNSFPTTDQRGVSRPQDGDLNSSQLPDIGAYERQITTYTVTNSSDNNDGVCDADCSLREALAATNAATTPDDLIAFDSSFSQTSHVIVLVNGQLSVSGGGTLVINGPGAGLLSISTNNASPSRIFMINTGAFALVKNLSVSGGNDTSQAGTNGGGGIRVEGFLALMNANVVNNRAASSGGGIYVRNGRVIIKNSNISNNRADTSGGALYINVGSVTVSETIFDQNTSGSSGGAIENGIGALVADKITVTRNLANGLGGGINNDSGMTISNSVISDNVSITTSFGGGGGISARSSTTATNLTISGNQALSGGGIWVDGFDTVANFSNILVYNNSARGNGGGIRHAEGVLNLINSTLNRNTVTNSSSTEGFGGGIFNTATTNLTNVTVAGNTTGNAGGGIRNGSLGTGAGTVNMRNTIVANNTSPVSPDFQGTITSQGYNLIRNTFGTTISGTTTGNILGQDPKLGALSLNGGSTRTFAILPASPAIDAADPANFPATDQRGVARPKDGDRNGTPLPDIGAFERDPVADSNAPYDFDGDGKSDISVWRASTGSWWYLHSSDLTGHGHSFGLETDIITPGDFTGDGKWDVAIWRPSTGEWFIRRSEDGSYFAYSFGLPGDIPAPADYDGDGITDTATFRPSTATWYIFNSGSSTYSILTFGLDGDRPVPADFDGDGKADIATWRPSSGTWWVVQSSDLQQKGYGFGLGTDKPVVGDYTGDGKADIAVWRDLTREWFFLRSEDGSYYSYQSGLSGDIPAPGDYDGDGRFDSAVFRPSTQTWYIDGSTAGSMILTFGLNGDRPVANAYVP